MKRKNKDKRESRRIERELEQLLQMPSIGSLVECSECGGWALPYGGKIVKGKFVCADCVEG
jgi:formylmethanofuran dehydrogenase subunit E